MDKANQSVVLLVTHNGMGATDQELGHRLFSTYLKLLHDSNILPNAICFYTEEVKLVIKSSPVLDDLKSLEAKGVRLIICSTCLNYYGLINEVSVGIVGGMPDIIEAQWDADKVISI